MNRMNKGWHSHSGKHTEHERSSGMNGTDKSSTHILTKRDRVRKLTVNRTKRGSTHILADENRARKKEVSKQAAKRTNKGQHSQARKQRKSERSQQVVNGTMRNGIHKLASRDRV